MFGILLVLGGLFMVVVTIAGASIPDVGPWAMVAFSVCDAVLLVPGFLLLYLYMRASAQDKLYQSVGAILRSVRDIGVDEVAKRIGKTPAETEVLISETVAAGHAQGYVDPKERKFIATAWGGLAPGQVPQIYVQAPAPVYIPQPVYAPPPPLQVVREIVKVPCKYCGTLVETTATECPRCKAPVQ